MPATRPRRSGWSTSRPVSTTPTLTPLPVATRCTAERKLGDVALEVGVGIVVAVLVGRLARRRLARRRLARRRLARRRREHAEALHRLRHGHPRIGAQPPQHRPHVGAGRCLVDDARGVVERAHRPRRDLLQPVLGGQLGALALPQHRRSRLEEDQDLTGGVDRALGDRGGSGRRRAAAHRRAAATAEKRRESERGDRRRPRRGAPPQPRAKSDHPPAPATGSAKRTCGSARRCSSTSDSGSAPAPAGTAMV